MFSSLKNLNFWEPDFGKPQLWKNPFPKLKLSCSLLRLAGGLIGLLVFVALIVSSVTMIRVYAMHKPVPQVFQSVRKRFANDAVTSHNELYMASDATEMGSHKDNRYRVRSWDLSVYFCRRHSSSRHHQCHGRCHLHRHHHRYVSPHVDVSHKTAHASNRVVYCKWYFLVETYPSTVKKCKKIHTHVDEYPSIIMCRL